MVFDKTAFLNSKTGKNVRHLLKDHLDLLDGRPVKLAPGNNLGKIDYIVNGENWSLYPVMPEWCINGPQQISLFDTQPN